MSHPEPTQRGLAYAFAVCALAEIALLSSHPNDGARTFADFVQYEATHQLIDGIVHGGFIGVLVALTVCLVLLSRLLGLARVPIVIALVAFCVGCGALTASMILDGLVTPALAARLAGSDTPDNVVMTKTVFLLIGTLIRFLMPIGLILIFVAIGNLSAAVVGAKGWGRFVGVFGLTASALMIVALFAAPGKAAAHIMLGGILLQALWYLALAALLFRGALPRTRGEVIHTPL